MGGPKKRNNRSTMMKYKSKCTIDSLPDEVLVEIFQFFSIQERIRTIKNVCGRWRKLINDKILWKNTFYNPGINETIELTNWTLEFIPALHGIELKTKIDHSHLECFLRALSNCRNLKILKLSPYQSINKSAFKKLTKNFPRLEFLRFRLHIKNDLSYAEEFANLKYLKHLDLSNSKFKSSEVIKKIIDNCELLEVIHLRKCSPFEESDLEYIIEQKKDKLIELVIDGLYLKDFSFKVLQKCKRLKQLSVHECIILTEDCIRCLENIKTLESLTLTELSNIRHIQTPPCLKFFSNLKELNLEECFMLNDESVKELSEYCSKLEILILSRCYQLTDNSMLNILKNCVNLTVLGLSHCNIQGIYLNIIPLHLKKLQELYLEYCQLSFDINILKKECPDLVIHV